MAPKGKGGGGGRATAVVEESNKTADGVARYTRPTSRKNLSTQLRTAATPLNLICFWPWLRGCPPCSCFSWYFGLPAPSPWGGSAGRYCGTIITDMLVFVEPVFPFPPVCPFLPFALSFLLLLGTLGGHGGDEVGMYAVVRYSGRYRTDQAATHLTL